MVQNRDMQAYRVTASVAGRGRWCPIRSTAALLLVLLTGACAGGPGGDDIFPFPVSTFELDNGLKVVAVEYDSPGIVAYYTVVRAGSRNEVEPGFTGYAHFFEHMMFRGTERYPTDAYNAVIKRMGADSNAFTTNDWTAYHIVASADALETIMEIESDRFLNLQYSEDGYRTEAGAILGEYNLNFSNPVALLQERLRARAFRFHPYGHTTLGLLADIQEMPNHYDYSLEFYDRYYRPNNSIIVVVGDVDRGELERLAEQYYGAWEPGDHEPLIPVGGAPDAAAQRQRHLAEPDPVVPHAGLSRSGLQRPDDRHADARRAVATAVRRDGAAVPQAVPGGAGGRRALGRCARQAATPGCSRSSRASPTRSVSNMWRDAIIAEIERLKVEPVDEQVLAETKSHMRYQFALGLDNPGGVARTLAHYLQLTADPETVNRVVPAVRRRHAGRHPARGGDVLPGDEPHRGDADAGGGVGRRGGGRAMTGRVMTGRAMLSALLAAVWLAGAGCGGPGPSAESTPAGAGFRAPDSPIVNLRIVFRTGSIDDPDGLHGLNAVTALMIGAGGTESLAYEDLAQVLYPWSASISARYDKEVTTITGRVHRDHLEPFYAIVRDLIATPRFDPADFERNRDRLRNGVVSTLRGNDDEELGKEALNALMYRGHPVRGAGHGHRGRPGGRSRWMTCAPSTRAATRGTISWPARAAATRPGSSSGSSPTCATACRRATRRRPRCPRPARWRASSCWSWRRRRSPPPYPSASRST